MAGAGNDSVLLTASMDGGSVNSSAMWSSMSDHVADALRVAAERRAKVAHLHSQMQDLEIGVLARGARTQRQPRPVTAVARPGRALGEPGWSSHDESDSRQHTARSTSDWSVLSSVMTASSAVPSTLERAASRSEQNLGEHGQAEQAGRQPSRLRGANTAQQGRGRGTKPSRQRAESSPPAAAQRRACGGGERSTGQDAVVKEYEELIPDLHEEIEALRRELAGERAKRAADAATHAKEKARHAQERDALKAQATAARTRAEELEAQIQQVGLERDAALDSCAYIYMYLYISLYR